MDQGLLVVIKCLVEIISDAHLFYGAVLVWRILGRVIRHLGGIVWYLSRLKKRTWFV